MTSVLGVDGGQSGIRLRHSSDERVVEVAGVSRLEGDDVSAVAGAIAQGWHDAAFPVAERAVLGLTTAPTDPTASGRLCTLVAGATGVAEVWLADDAVTAHAGALSLGWGVSLVAGTGVACLALPEDGEPRIIGGHGFLLGDEGGAFWIGRQGLRAVLRSSDGRDEATALTDAAERRFGDLADLPVRLHGVARPVNAIAHFAPDVLAAAAEGDPIANDILDEAARELVLVAGAAARSVADDDTVAVPIALGGRLLEPETELRRRVEGLLAREPVLTAARTADATPLEGAILLGRDGDPGRYRSLIHIWQAGAAA